MEDLIALEGTQARFTRILYGLECFCNESWLVRLGLLSLDQWTLSDGLHCGVQNNEGHKKHSYEWGWWRQDASHPLKSAWFSIWLRKKSHPLKSTWMSFWHNITFKAMGQVLASGISWAGQGLPCISADSMGRRALQYSVILWTLVRPQFEYCVWFWSQHYRKVVIALERRQRGFTWILTGMGNFSYEERLGRHGLFLLEERREEWGVTWSTCTRLFQTRAEWIRSSYSPLLKGKTRVDIGARWESGCLGGMRKNIFTQRVLTVWNVLLGGWWRRVTSHPFKSTLMSTYHVITFRAMGQVLADRIRCEFRFF